MSQILREPHQNDREALGSLRERLGAASHKRLTSQASDKALTKKFFSNKET